MFAPEFLAERLNEQIKLAGSMAENGTPGGRCSEMIERLKEGQNRAHHIQMLRTVESGPRRYAKHFANAIPHIERMAEIFARVELVRNAGYDSNEQREKAMANLKSVPKEIEACCQAALKEVEAALKVMEEGEKREVTLSAGTK